MKQSCELIQDLLPLYAEGICSEASRRAVEEHLHECAACRKLSTPLPEVEAPEVPAQADRAVKKSIKRVRRRWLVSLIAALLIVPVLLLSVNQFRGVGLCFTNLDDLIAARRFLSALEGQDWERAAAMYDFSEDYQGIQEALSLPVESWGSTFTPVTLDGEAWMLRSYLDCNAMEGTAAEALFAFLYNRVGTAMVPSSLWEQVITIDPDAVQQEGGQYWLNDEFYGTVTTPWGDYVISEALHYDTAADYCSRLDLVPAAIYQEAEADLTAEAQELYDNTHNAYGYVADMTETEFQAAMVQQYAADLKEIESMGVRFDCTGYYSAYRTSDDDGTACWHIQLSVTITYQDESLPTVMAICLEQGHVRLVSLSYRQQTAWLDELDKALYPSAHPDY